MFYFKREVGTKEWFYAMEESFDKQNPHYEYRWAFISTQV